MKKLIFIALIFICIGSIYGQTKKKVVAKSISAKSQTANATTIKDQVSVIGTKTFSGPFTVGESSGTATYEYLEDSTGSRVFNGKFTYSGKIGENLIETISGYYKKDLKDGYWIYNSKTIPGLRTISDQKFYGTYRDGYPDGLWTLNYLTKFTSGTVNSGKSLTGTTITITGTANYKNKHLFGAFNFENKQTGDNLKPVSVQGSFDENGFMDGKWIAKWAPRMNAPVFDVSMDYKNGVLSHTRVIDSQTGKAENEDFPDHIDILSKYDSLTNLYICNNNNIYSAKIVNAGGDSNTFGGIVKLAKNYFCKDEDHYHINTKGCLDCCSTIKFIEMERVKYNGLANDATSKGEFKKAARIYGYLIKAEPNDAGINYRCLSWTNCLSGNFTENINVCMEGQKIATGDDKNVILKNLGHSYLFTNQYDEAKKYYLEFANNNLNKLKEILEHDFDTMNQAGIKNVDCDKMKNEVKSLIENKK